MWAPWRVARLVGGATGLASCLGLLRTDALYAIASGAIFLVQIALLARLCSWASRRPLLPAKWALFLATTIALSAFFASAAFETHAVVYAPSVEAAQEALMLRMSLIASAPYAVAIVASLAIYRIFGAVPDAAQESAPRVDP